MLEKKLQVGLKIVNFSMKTWCTLILKDAVQMFYASDYYILLTKNYLFL